MKKVPLFEDFVPIGFGGDNAASFSLGGVNNVETGYNMDAIVGPVNQCCSHVAEQANMYETNDNPDHTAEAYIKEAKKHINDKIDEAYENYSATNGYLTEAEDYEFNPSEAAERLKKREKENIQRYRAAQDRGDNFAIELYSLRVKLDKMDLERLKVKTAIHDLKNKYDK